MYHKLFLTTKEILNRENEMLNEEVEWFQQNAFQYMAEEDKNKFAQYSVLIQQVSQGIKAQSENLTKEGIEKIINSASSPEEKNKVFKIK